MSSREIAKSLTPALRAAMENARGTHTGSTVPAHHLSPKIRQELQLLGVLGPHDGLTDVGANVAMIVKREQEDRLFG